MIRRLLIWLKTNAICFDQWVQVIVRGPKYILFNGPKPSADETLSDWIGQSADEGIPIGKAGQNVVDFIFMNPNHCQQAISDDSQD